MKDRRLFACFALAFALLLSSAFAEAKYNLAPFTSNLNFDVRAEDGHIWIEYSNDLFGLGSIEGSPLDDPNWDSGLIRFLTFNPEVFADGNDPDLPPLFTVSLCYMNFFEDPNGIEEIRFEAGGQVFRFHSPGLTRIIIPTDTMGDVYLSTVSDFFLTPDTIGLLQAILDAPEGRVKIIIDAGLPFYGTLTFTGRQLSGLREMYYAYLSCGALSNDFSAVSKKGLHEITYGMSYEEIAKERSGSGAPQPFRKEGRTRNVDVSLLRDPDTFEIQELSNDQYRFEYATYKSFTPEFGMFSPVMGDYPIGGGEWMLVIDENDEDRTELALKFWLDCYSDTPMHIHAVSFDLSGKRYTFDVSRNHFDLDDEENVFHERIGITPANFSDIVYPGSAEFMVDMLSIVAPLVGQEDELSKTLDALQIPVILHGDQDYPVRINGWILSDFYLMFNACQRCNGLDCLRSSIPTPITVRELP